MAEREIAVTIKFLVNFRDLFGGKEREVRLPAGSSVGQMLRRICDTPRLQHEILAGEELRAQIVVLKNGIPIQSIKGLATELADGDTVAIFPFLAGG